MSEAAVDAEGTTAHRDSIFRAASALHEVLRDDPTGAHWRQRLRTALGGCVLAVEAHLVSLSSPEGMDHEAGEREPRLIPALEQLGVALSELMIHLWETREEAGHPGPLVMRRLERLVDEMRDVAAEEFGLVIESFRPTGTVD